MTRLFSCDQAAELVTSDLSPEEKLVRALELRQEEAGLAALLQDCERAPDCAELAAGARAGLQDYRSALARPQSQHSITTRWKLHFISGC